MILQNILFPNVKICTEENLYFRNYNCKYSWAKQEILFSKDSTMSFDTYFNSFSIYKWSKYTTIKSLQLKITFKGDFMLTIWHKTKIENTIHSTALKEEYVSSNDTSSIAFDIPLDFTSGQISFTLKALNDNSIFYGGAYYTNNTPVNKIKLGIGICTYKREVFVKRNIFNINNYHIPDDELEIFVVDNAKTLPKEDICLAQNIHLIPNNNLGGSGGFTRSLVEMINYNEQNNSKITYALLMDDDVVVDPDTILRTINLLKFLKPEYIDSYIGGAMLRFDKDKNIQVEAGARWNGGNLVSLKSGLDLNNLDACLYNDVEETAEFNAWWYCVIPMQFVRNDNLPLPLFIRGDDVEYGLRNMSRLILLNGICVWHEPFENKYSSNMFYYIIRNRLIDNSIHQIPLDNHFVKDTQKMIMHELMGYRYKNVELFFKGIEDFKKGPKWFMEQNSADIHKEIIAKAYKFVNIEDSPLPFSYPEFNNSYTLEDKSKFSKRYRKLTFNGLFSKPSGTTAIVHVQKNRPINFYKKDTALYYDPVSHKCFTTAKDKKLTIKYLMQMLKLKKFVKYEYPKYSKMYYENKNALTNISLWNKLFD